MSDYRTFRVRKPFTWNGVDLRPGDTWLVDMSDERANRIDVMVGPGRHAIYDPALPSGDEAVKSRDLRRQLPRKALAR